MLKPYTISVIFSDKTQILLLLKKNIKISIYKHAMLDKHRNMQMYFINLNQ